MARKKTKKRSKRANAVIKYAGANASLGSRYATAKREYHAAGEALFKARHGGRSAREVAASRKRKSTKHKHSR